MFILMFRFFVKSYFLLGGVHFYFVTHSSSSFVSSLSVFIKSTT